MRPEDAHRSDAPWASDTERARTAYGRRAADYIEFAEDIMVATVPADRELIEGWAASAHGPLLDLGCGPGQWTAHLAQQGHRVVGMDPTPPLLHHARRVHPEIEFLDGGLEDLDPAAASWGGILAWYSLIHLGPSGMPATLDRLHTCLIPGGSLLVGFFDADDSLRARGERAGRPAYGAAPEPFPHAVTTAHRWPARTMASLLRDAGFGIEHIDRRTDPGARPHAAIIARR